MDKILGSRPITVPVLLVGSLWDAEDIYGYLAVWKALKPKDTQQHGAHGDRPLVSRPGH